MTHTLRAVVGTDPGLRRTANEDTAYAGYRLLALADGMGGHTRGDLASSIVIETLRELDKYEPLDEDPSDLLTRGFAEASRRLTDFAPAGSGTTLTALLWDDAWFTVGHIGDSRGYLLRDGVLHQFTRDHTLVQSMVDEGRITPEEAEVHPRRSVLIRAMQSGTTHDPDLSAHEGRAGDRYLLCSDGLTDVVSAGAIHEVLGTTPDPDAAVRRLIALALEAGGPDNVTCVLADLLPADS